jgi:hypothetical protein
MMDDLAASSKATTLATSMPFCESTAADKRPTTLRIVATNAARASERA